jgi:hypothetical protein
MLPAHKCSEIARKIFGYICDIARRSHPLHGIKGFYEISELPEPRISDSKGVASPDTRLQTPAVASSSSPSSLTTTPMNWNKYKEYLSANLRPNTARLTLKYGKKYSYVLERMDIKDLLVLPPAKQRHIMKALANLAKYNGVYEQWNSLRRQHKLKWSSTNTLDIFERIMNNGTSYDKMLEYIKRVLAVLPRSHANVVIFGTLTGLRPIEACKSVQLIHADLSNYLNSDLLSWNISNGRTSLSGEQKKPSLVS